jgi:hypothetical protein
VNHPSFQVTVAVTRKSGSDKFWVLVTPARPSPFVQGGSKTRKLENLDFETDKHRAMVCDMQKEIELAVDDRMGDKSDLSRERKAIFFRQVEEEERKDIEAGCHRTDARKPYKARAALGLILLLSSVLW